MKSEFSVAGGFNAYLNRITRKSRKFWEAKVEFSRDTVIGRSGLETQLSSVIENLVTFSTVIKEYYYGPNFIYFDF